MGDQSMLESVRDVGSIFFSNLQSQGKPSLGQKIIKFILTDEMLFH